MSNDFVHDNLIKCLFRPELEGGGPCLRLHLVHQLLSILDTLLTNLVRRFKKIIVIFFFSKKILLLPKFRVTRNFTLHRALFSQRKKLINRYNVNRRNIRGYLYFQYRSLYVQQPGMRIRFWQNFGSRALYPYRQEIFKLLE